MTTVAVLSLGWKLNDDSFSRLASRKRCTWFSVSFTKPKGDTEPGRRPNHFSIRCSEAKESFP